MSVNVIDTIKPKNGGSFPVVEAVDVKVSDSQRLDAALAAKANTSDLAALSTTITNKADKSDIIDIRSTLALKAYQSSLDATNAVVATKAAQSSLDALSVIVDRKADKRDYDNIYAAIDQKASKTELSTATTNLEHSMEQADDDLQAQIDQIVISSSAEAVVAPEVAAARVDSEGNSYETLKAHLDASENKFNSKLADINSTISTGFNLLNTETVKRNYILSAEGVEGAYTGAFASDYIAVKPSTDYKVDRAIGSGTYPTVCYYDENKDFISASDGSSTTFTTPNTCYYVRTNGSLTYLEQSMFSPAYVTARFSYKKVVNGTNNMTYQLWSADNIFYYDGGLHSKSYIYLTNAESMTMPNCGKDITVTGNGAFLYWDKSNGSFIASNDNLSSDTVYFIALLKYGSFDTGLKFTSLTCAYPAFTFDFIANKLYIDFKYYGYILYNGQTIQIDKDYTQELNIGENSLIVYNVKTGAFESVQYSAVQYEKSKYIPICVRNYSDVVGNCDYQTVLSNKSYKSCLCYGDSLTWYDGHEFTWGEHQGEMCIGFESYLRSYVRMAVQNVGVMGETTPEICARLVSDSAPATADYITIMGGDNDDRLSLTAGTVLPVGSTFDRTTVAGALQYAIENVLGRNPDVRIILMTEPMGWTYRNGEMIRVNEAYPQVYRDVAKMYGLPLVDNWYESGINELNRSEYMIDPSLADGNTYYIYHPSNKAWERIARNLCEVLKKY